MERAAHPTRGGFYSSAAPLSPQTFQYFLSLGNLSHTLLSSRSLSKTFTSMNLAKTFALVHGPFVHFGVLRAFHTLSFTRSFVHFHFQELSIHFPFTCHTLPTPGNFHTHFPKSLFLKLLYRQCHKILSSNLSSNCYSGFLSFLKNFCAAIQRNVKLCILSGFQDIRNKILNWTMKNLKKSNQP